MNQEQPVDAYQEHLKKKRHNDQVRAKTSGPIIFGQPNGGAEPSPTEQATERFLAAVATLPHVEQYIVMAYYGLNFPRQNVKAIRQRIKETKGFSISGGEVSARRRNATWYIAGALQAAPKEVQKVLDDHRDRLLDLEKRTPREQEEVEEMQAKELSGEMREKMSPEDFEKERVQTPEIPVKGEDNVRSLDAQREGSGDGSTEG